MAIKSILVSVDESPQFAALLETVWLIAEPDGSFVEGLYLRPAMGALVAADGMSMAAQAALDDFEQEERIREQRLRGRFEDFFGSKQVPVGADAAPQAGSSANWLEQDTTGDQVIGSHGRAFDLIATGRPARDADVPRMSALESALFESGRPVIVAPPAPPKTLGEVVVVAWNGSTESARSVAFAMPFLADAKEVHVLSVEGGSVSGPDARTLAHHLVRHGINATATDASPGDRSVGQTILEEAGARGADLLVKGAYTHSRLRQMFFGGATSHILAEAEIPVLMAH